MEKLPSFISISKRTFDLYVNSYMNVLPFLLVGAACEFAISKFLGSNPPKGFHLEGLIVSLINTLVYIMVFYGVYKSHMKNFELIEVITKSLKRFFPFLCAIIILILPLFLFFLITIVVVGLLKTHQPPGLDPSNIRLVSGAIVLIAIVIYSLVMIYFWPSSVLIIAKDMGPISGLKASWRLVRGYWLSTFTIVFAYTILLLGIFYLLTLLVPELWLRPLASLIFTSFGASLLVIVVESLEQAKKSY